MPDTPGSRRSEKRRAVPSPPAFDLAAVKGRRPVAFPLPSPCSLAPDCSGFWTGLGWTGFGLLSQTVLARLEDPLQLPAMHPSQVTIGLDRFHVSTSSAFSNQPSLDSLAREEKAPPPHPHTHNNNNHAAPNARARMLPQRSSLTRPDSLALTRQPVRRRRRLAGMESSADRIFPSPACSSFGTALAYSLIPSHHSLRRGEGGHLPCRRYLPA